MKELLKVIATISKQMGTDMSSYVMEKYKHVLVGLPVPHLGENILVQSHSYALTIAMTVMCANMSGKPSEEVNQDIQETIGKCLQELMAKYSKTGVALLIETKPLFEEEKGGTETKSP